MAAIRSRAASSAGAWPRYSALDGLALLGRAARRAPCRARPRPRADPTASSGVRLRRRREPERARWPGRRCRCRTSTCTRSRAGRSKSSGLAADEHDLARHPRVVPGRVDGPPLVPRQVRRRVASAESAPSRRRRCRRPLDVVEREPRASPRRSPRRSARKPREHEVAVVVATRAALGQRRVGQCLDAKAGDAAGWHARRRRRISSRPG